MPRVIVHPGHPLDHLRHPRQRPQVRVETVRPRPFSQRPVDLAQLCGFYSRHPPSPSRASQRFRAAPLPLPKPATHALTAHVQRAGHRRQAFPRAKQAARLLPPLLQALEVSARSHPTLTTTTTHAHARRIVHWRKSVTLLCEIQ
jgi:hypothetical protein